MSADGMHVTQPLNLVKEGMEHTIHEVRSRVPWTANGGAPPPRRLLSRPGAETEARASDRSAVYCTVLCQFTARNAVRFRRLKNCIGVKLLGSP
jgi:hypothetical protein